MAVIKDFAGLAEVQGVAQYLLVKKDGSTLATNMDSPGLLAVTVVGCGQHCENLSGAVGGQNYIHLCLERESGDNLMVFSLGGFYLGVISESSTASQMVVSNVISFLKTIN
ncbi:MAG: hypothetical protein ABFS19_00590 [Thermodesulfobacteriota bacterium]